MLSRPRLVFSCLTALLTASATAQLPARILALPDSGPGLLTISQTCAVSTCPPTLGPTPNAWAGGTAHDPRDRSTWISNGPLIAKVNPRTGCNVTCAPFPAPNLAAGQVVTGLAYNEDTNRLFVSHSDNRILTYSVAGCSLTLISQCAVSVPTNHVISGLATDDANQRIWYVSCPWLGPNSSSRGRCFRRRRKATRARRRAVRCRSTTAPSFPRNRCRG